jgi:hypothetical protein
MWRVLAVLMAMILHCLTVWSAPSASEALLGVANPLQLRRLAVDVGIPSISVDWTSVMTTSRTSVTLQVVSNALLDRKTPVSSAMFKSLSQLPLDNIRYVPWFPMPLYGVPELLPPANGATSWNFTYAQPMLEDFFAATKGNGTSTLPNFSTQPAWMYKNWTGPQYPLNPFTTDFGYARGTELVDPSGQQLVEYFQRLLQWIVKGHFVDEAGKEHTGGPGVALTQWEVFNEPQKCHGMTVQQYTDLYDKIVTGIREAVDPEGNMRFAMGALEQPNGQLEWAEYLLDPANHAAGAGRDSLDGGLLTFHFYASSSSRTDPTAYEGFFPACDTFATTVLDPMLQTRNTTSPSTLLSCDEMGVILPGDNSPTAAQFPLVYWNAAAAKFAYIFSIFTRLGIDIAGMSQLAGGPALPEWGITDPQYPSVAILNWTTGEGTARYWTLGMIHEQIAPGAQVMTTTVSSNPVCGVVGSSSGVSDMTLSCSAPGARIVGIDFADYGMPTGSCGAYAHNATCTSPEAASLVEAVCVGQSSCTVSPESMSGLACGSSSMSLVVQARCSEGGGDAGAAAAVGVSAQAYQDPDGSNRRVLLVNKEFAAVSVNISSLLSSVVRSGGAEVLIVDEATGFGPAREEAVSGSTLELSAFAVAVLLL